MGRVESKKRGEGSRKEETGGGTTEASRGGEITEGGSRETDEGRGGMTEAKRGGRHFLSGSRSTGSGCTSAAKELVEGDESGEGVQKGIAHWDKQNHAVPAPNCALKVRGEIIKVEGL